MFPLIPENKSTIRAKNFRQGIVMKTSFETLVSQMGLGSFVDINIFCYEILFYLVSSSSSSSSYSPFLSNLLNQNLQNEIRLQKGNSGVLFNDTLLNFGLSSLGVPEQIVQFKILKSYLFD